jgi:RNA polymerase sigma-70 factor (ECF subfamily)
MARLPLFRRTRVSAAQFEGLLRPHLEFLYRLAWRFSGSVADAEDLVQDMLLKLYPRAAQIASIEQLRPWLARVLYRQYVDLVRRRARSPEEPADLEALEAAAALEDGPESRAERGELRARLLAALDGLNAEQRAVVVMHDVEGYSLEELESILDAPLGTLKSRLHRARERLRARLGLEPSGDGERVKR